MPNPTLRRKLGSLRSLSPVPQAGLQLWLDGSDARKLFQDAALSTPVQLDADPVGGWRDRSGGGNNATQPTSASRASWKTAALNGKPVVRYNGSTSSLPTPLSLANRGMSIFIVYRGGARAVNGLVSHTGAAPYQTFWMGAESPSAPNLTVYKGDGGGGYLTLAGASLLAAGVPYLFSALVSAGDYCRTFLNGSAEKSATLAKSASWTVSIGETAYRAVAGDVAEVLIYNRSVTAAERQQIEGYLGAKWGIVLIPGTYSNVGGYQSYAPTAGAANGIGSGATVSAEAVSVGHTYQMRQSGVLARVRFYAASLTNLTSFAVKVWRKNGGGSYDLVGASENLLSKMSAGQCCTIVLGTPIAGVQEGDVLGYRAAWSGGQSNNFVAQAFSGVTTYTALDATPGPTGYAWESQAATANAALVIEPYMAPPYFMALGDSLVAGHPNNYSNIELTATSAPAQTFERHLSALWGGAAYQNMGIGGQTTTAIAARLTTDLLDVNPSVAILEGGINDIALGGANTQAVFLANWMALLSACRDNGIRPVVLTIFAWTSGTNAQMQARDQWNAALATLAATYGAVVVDTSSYIGQFRAGGDAGNLWNIQPAYNCGDDVHLNDAGYAQVAQAIYAALPH